MSYSITRSLFFVLLLSVVSACAKNEATLEVRVFTGLVPGPEFRTVETRILPAAPTSASSTVLESQDAVARFGNDYARGHRVAAFTLARGSYRARVRLLRPNGTLLVEHIVAFTLNGNYVLPVHITRDCVGVECPSPGGSPELTTCLEGRCVDPRCTPDVPQFCPDILFCNDKSECGPVAACATQECADGICTPAQVESACVSTEWCNPDVGVGCQPLEPTDDSGIVCGTICVRSGEACRFGYWNCASSGAPVCDDLLGRPSGTACGAGRVCDIAANCINVPAVLVAPTSGLVTSEAGGSATFSVVLGTQPSAGVDIPISSSNTAEGTVSPPTVHFTVDDWNAPKVITVTGVDDAIADGNASYIVVTGAATSLDSNYAGLDAADVAVTNTDNDSAGVTLTRTTGLSTSESGSTDSFEATLNIAPSAVVTIALSSSNPLEANVSPATLTFTPLDYASPHTVTVTGVDDAIRDGDQPFSIATGVTMSADLAYDGIDVPDVSGTNQDDDTASILVSPTAGLVTSESLATAAFSVSLQTQPSANVTVPIASGDLSEGSALPASLTFTPLNWSTPQTVTVTGADDAIADGNQPYTVSVGPSTSTDAFYSALSGTAVSVTNLDNEAPYVSVTPTNGLGTTESGGTATFSVSLGLAPTADVSFTLTSSNVAEGTVSPTSLTFTSSNWSVPRTVTVTGVDDALMDGNAAYTIITSATTSSQALWNGVAVPDVSATNYDNEIVVGTTVTPTSGLITSESGTNSSFSVVLNAAPSADVTINLSSSNSAEGVPSPSAITFTTANWSTPQIVAVNGVDDGILDGDVAYSIITSATSSADLNYNGLTVMDVSATNRTRVAQQAFVKASVSDAGDQFATSIALSNDGNTVVIGSPYEDSNATGIGGVQTDNTAANAGAVYVFTRSGSVWTQQAYIKASNAESGDSFGATVSLSADGNTLAVGARGEASAATGIDGNQLDNSLYVAGAVYVFTRSGSTWSQQAYVKASNTGNQDTFGNPLALSADGTTLAVGAISEESTATGINGDQLDNTRASGAVYVFTRVTSVWSQQAYIKASNNDVFGLNGFGDSLAISANGSTLAVGNSTEWSNGSGVNGNQRDSSAWGTGAVYLFSRTGTTWSQQAYLKSAYTNMYDYFGISLALSSDGNLLAVGAPGEASIAIGIGGDQTDNSQSWAGAVFIFSRAGVTWTQSAYIKPPTVRNGANLGIRVVMSQDGNTLAASASDDSSGATGVNGNQFDTSQSQSGAIFVMSRDSGVWSHRLYLKASNPGTTDLMGLSMGISGDGHTLIGGAAREDSAASGINGDGTSNSSMDSGAAYIFTTE